MLATEILLNLERPCMPNKEKHLFNFYTKKELNQVFEIFKGDPLEFIIKLTAFYDFRRSEVLSLKWKQIDFENKKIHLTNTVGECVIDNKLVYFEKERTKQMAS